MALSIRKRAFHRGREKGVSFGVEQVAGAAAATDIAVPGMKADDQLLYVGEFVTGASPAVRTATSTIQANGALRVTTATTGNQLLVIFSSS